MMCQKLLMMMSKMYSIFDGWKNVIDILLMGGLYTKKISNFQNCNETNIQPWTCSEMKIEEPRFIYVKFGFS